MLETLGLLGKDVRANDVYNTSYLRGYIIRTLCEAISNGTLSLEEVKLSAINYYICGKIKVEDLYHIDDYAQTKNLSVFDEDIPCKAVSLSL